MASVYPTQSVSVISRRHREPGLHRPLLLVRPPATAPFSVVLPARDRPHRGHRAHDQTLSDRWLSDAVDQRHRQRANTAEANPDSKSATAVVAEGVVG